MKSILDCDKEIEYLYQEASRIADEYMAWVKTLPPWSCRLWIRVRRVRGTLQIEWVVPRWVGKEENRKRFNTYLPKGKSDRYPSRRLCANVDDPYRDAVMEYERRLSEIRKATRLFGEARRAWGKYEAQLSRMGLSQAATELHNTL